MAWYRRARFDGIGNCDEWGPRAAERSRNHRASGGLNFALGFGWMGNYQQRTAKLLTVFGRGLGQKTTVSAADLSCWLLFRCI
jgi:hypothetical protein